MNSPVVGCPACGGPIHPIASRCKHCKTDLLKLRENARRAARMSPQTPPQAPANNNNAAAQPSGPVPAHSPPPAELTANLVELPPATASFWSRRWPIIIGIAAIAIIAVSASLLAGGGGDDDSADRTVDGTTSKSPQPMPGMQNPTIPGQGPFGLAPPPRDPGAAPTPPAPPSSSLPGLGQNPFAVKPRKSGSRTPPQNYQEFMSAMAVSVCEKMTDCGVIDKSAGSLCDMLADSNTSLGLGQMPPSSAGKTCTFDPDAASDCLDALDGLSCTAVGVDNLLGLAAGMSRCVDAQVCR